MLQHCRDEWLLLIANSYDDIAQLCTSYILADVVSEASAAA
ncbi:hypothetical protein [Xanthomonas sp. MUS 060]|nr:hypothetical protein [Xanthomonas sp. MUS 060]